MYIISYHCETNRVHFEIKLLINFHKYYYCVPVTLLDNASEVCGSILLQNFTKCSNLAEKIMRLSVRPAFERNEGFHRRQPPFPVINGHITHSQTHAHTHTRTHTRTHTHARARARVRQSQASSMPALDNTDSDLFHLHLLHNKLLLMEHTRFAVECMRAGELLCPK